MDENLKITLFGKESKSALAYIDNGEKTANLIKGSQFDLLRAYGDITVKLYKAFVKSGASESKAARMLQAGIMASAEIEKVNLGGMFSGGNDAVLYVTREDEEHLACAIDHDADDARICTALACAIGDVKERLESKYGEKFAKYLLFKTYCIAIGEMDFGGKTKGEE